MQFIPKGCKILKSEVTVTVNFEYGKTESKTHITHPERSQREHDDEYSDESDNFE